MNLQQALDNPYLKRYKERGDRTGQICRCVIQCLMYEAPRKMLDKITATSQLKLNDIGSLMEGEIDWDADIPGLNNKTITMLWNHTARILPR